jgi:hypothetical protein
VNREVGVLLRSGFEAPWTSTRVVDREHVDAVVADDVVDAEREAPKPSAAYATLHLRRALGMLFDAIETGFHCREERFTEPLVARLVPGVGLGHVELGAAPNP